MLNLSASSETTGKLVFKQLLFLVVLKTSGPARLLSKAAALAAEFAVIAVKSAPQLADAAKLMVQHTCFNAPEKADQRAKTAAVRRETNHSPTDCLQHVGALVMALPASMRPGMYQWIVTFSKNNKPACRTFAVELALELLLVRESCHPFTHSLLPG